MNHLLEKWEMNLNFMLLIVIIFERHVATSYNKLLAFCKGMYMYTVCMIYAHLPIHPSSPDIHSLTHAFI